MNSTMFCDGGCNPNPGPHSSAGVVCFDDDGKVLFEISEPLGEGTNNTAEYWALILGIREFRLFPHSETGNIDIKMDSKLVVEQVNGRWKVNKDTLKPLHALAIQELENLPSWTLRWVAREGNTWADKLATSAMEKAYGTIRGK